ncbi:MAG TPA: hypothetical protein VLF41_01385 [Candidatus Nanoarchaeia archaeon]|nr:hypothetical protein [Candidatus Nanoarchaeia archaeon]
MRVILTFDIPYGSPGLSEGTNQFTIDANSTIYPSTHSQHEFDFTIPAAFRDPYGHTIYGYAIDQNNGNGVAFNSNDPISFGPCVARTWDLELTIQSTSSSRYSGGTLDSPGSVDPGGVIDLEAYVYNRGNGDSPSFNITSYQPTDAAGPTDRNGNLTSQGYSGIPSSSTSAPMFYSYTVPAGATDGSIYCFGGDVQPGAGDSNGNITSAKNVWDPITNHSTEATCFKVVATRYPYLTTSYGDIHAGGGINLGVACSRDDPNTANDFIQGSLQHPLDVSYVASAGGRIAATNSQQYFGNSPLGKYGLVCRPDLVTLAEAAKTGTNVIPTCSPSAAQMQGNAAVETILYCAPGASGSPDVTLPAATNVVGRVTFYAPTYNVIISGNIRFNSSVVTVDNLPAFGLITGKDVFIDRSVTQLDGYYYAVGNVDTCTAGNVSIDIHTSADSCSNTLTLYGLTMAHGYRFARTGPAGFNGSTLGESFNFIGDIYIAPPPVFKDVISQTAARPRYSGELPPLY